MDGLASRSLLLASLVLGAALCIGLAATAHYLTAGRPAGKVAPVVIRPSRQPVALPPAPADDMTTSSIGSPGAAPKPR